MDLRVEALSLYERAAQLMMPRVGSNMPPPVTVAEDLARVEALLDRCPLGGLVLFNGSLDETPSTLAALQRKCRVPLLVATDMERGVGQQVRGATVFPHAMAFGAGSLEEAEARLEAAARVQAREALACGIHVTFAPVADVNRNPRNPIIATRAFGTEPEATARLVAAYVRGCRAEGLLSTAKHFPGHGDTSQDSHAELPHVTDDRDTLLRTDLVPFRAAVEAGVELIMTAHVAYPSLDPAGRAATLSPPILNDLLRGTLGFDGVVVTDSLLMGAVREMFPDAGAQAVALLASGVDLLLDVSDPEAAVEGIVRAVEEGTLSPEQVEASCRRVLALKRRLADRFGPTFFTDPGAVVPLQEAGAEAHRRQAYVVARRAVQLVATGSGALPLDPTARTLVVLVKPHRSRLDPPLEPMERFVREAFPHGVYRQAGPETPAETYEALLAEAGAAQQIVLALVVKPAAWHAFGLRPEQQRFADALTRRPGVVLAALGSPVVLEDYPSAAARLCTFSDVEVSQRALVDALLEPAAS